MSFVRAREAFFGAIAHVRRSLEPVLAEVAPRRANDPRFAAVAVPGLHAFEWRREARHVRGWANADGLVVLARRQTLAPIVAAMGGLAGEAEAEAIAARIAWAFGDGYALITAKPSDVRGRCGEIHPPRLRPFAKGVRFTACLRMTEAEAHGKRTILEQLVEVGDDHQRCGVYELWPKPTREEPE